MLASFCDSVYEVCFPRIAELTERAEVALPIRQGCQWPRRVAMPMVTVPAI